MGLHTIQIAGVPTLTVATFVGIVLLFIVLALYVGIQFDPLTEDEIESQIREAKGNE